LLFAVFIAVNAHVQDLNNENFHSIVDGSKPAFVEFYAPWCGHCKRFASDYEIIGKAYDKFHERVVVAKVDCDAEANKPLCAEFGVQGFPTLTWFPKGETKNPTKYSGGRTVEDVIKYINENAGLNARAPGKDPSYVIDVTDDTFDSIVLDTKKNVLIEFYAPWCGHCKSLAPIYEKLGKAYANEEEIVIARIDADANKQIGTRFSIQGFPTLKYFPKNNKDGEDYDGGRELSDFISAINTKFGAKRDSEGLLDSSAGRVENLDVIVKKLVQGAKKDEVKKEVEEALASLSAGEHKDGKIYSALVDKYTAAYVESEIPRLKRLIESGSITSKKVDEFTRRINILNAFK